ncbi:MucR family transcriptional regulator [Sphingomonas jatrophae]|uniref:Transcriptional regulator, MucR family n=1 Tax=Sphingomonas jatrophae TaxID=1166337 RepID=A0A1I6M7N2_9SPHN|nr:MucR family transcriptional regulator [Sphingomonas jatrophae]SFS11618.1 transcriptional regulator, MucR family [Sphingomonas jatrophae]
MTADTDALLSLTADIITAHLSNNQVAAADLLELIRSTHAALAGLDALAPAPAEPEHVPAVSVRKSLASPDRIVSMIDGKPYTALKRHLATHGLTPAEYRARYKLPADYPMVAPTYSEKRKALAVQLGLGRRKAEPAVAEGASAAEAPAPEPKRRGRKPAAESAGNAAGKPRGRKLSGAAALAKVREGSDEA